MSLYLDIDWDSSSQLQRYPIHGILSGISLFRDILLCMRYPILRISNRISLCWDIPGCCMGYPVTYLMGYNTGCPYIQISCWWYPMQYCTFYIGISLLFMGFPRFFWPCNISSICMRLLHKVQRLSEKNTMKPLQAFLKCYQTM